MYWTFYGLSSVCADDTWHQTDFFRVYTGSHQVNRTRFDRLRSVSFYLNVLLPILLNFLA